MTNIEVYAKSVCCNAPVKIANKVYECTKCKQPCDVRAFNIEKGSIIR